MRRIALGLACLVAAGGYVTGCGSTSGTAGNGNQGGSAGSGTGASGGSTASGGSGGSISAGGSGAGGSSASGGTGASSSGGSGNPDASGSGGSGASGYQDAAVPDVVFSYDGPADDGQQEACADLHVTAQPSPLDMYVMLDQSGSMGTDCNIGQNTNSKWCHAINALSGFFHDPSAASDRVALQYFALPMPPATCAGAGYDTPAINLGLLSSIANNLDSSLNAHGPSTLTPTEGALNGISKYTSTHQTSGRVMVGILITDGYPEGNGCNTDINTLAKIPQALYNNYGIRTFIIGMSGATYANLETWAVAGGAAAHTNYCASGTSSCHYYDVGAGNPQAFIDALKAIQKSALGCQYNMPTTDAGIVDPGKLSVQFTPSGGSAQTLSNAGSKSGCSGNDGFYYDNNQNPTTITLCPATCTKAGSGGDVNITVPCQGS